jgi:hypothetical protein
LNAELPILFDGWGHMEVDLICEQSRIAGAVGGLLNKLAGLS